MILAAADAAEGKGGPPPELTWAWRSAAWGLPGGRGWLNEPAGLVDRMTAALNTYNAVSSYRQRKPGSEGDWAAAHPVYWKIVQEVEELRRGRAH